ncbi:hypothetical protein [Phocaeicola dorei]|uniref:hypothetical protein n=1 Tax=Phocaeicola dorei TaxID=357276 RepID=UPI0034A48876
MLGSINNRGKVSEPCLSSPIITLHRGTLSIPPPRPQRGSDQTAASLNGVLRRSDSEEILQGSENGCVLILKKVYGVALVGTGGPAPCRWALPDR